METAVVVMNPLRQAARFDRAGDYVRRYVPELAGLDPALIHTPWQLDTRPRYPDPLLEPRASRRPGP